MPFPYKLPGDKRRSGYESYMGIDVGLEMYPRNAFVYIRIPFNIDMIQSYAEVICSVW